MDDLLALVKHEIEGEESHLVTMLFADSEPVTEQRRTFGAERWADHAKYGGDITVVQFLAIALFAVRDQFNLHRANSVDDRERRIVETWSEALRAAASSGAIIPRDPDSLLPLQAPSDDFKWRLAVADADTWLATQGFSWTCTQIIEHLYRQFYPDVVGGKMPDGAAKPATEAVEHGEPAKTGDGRTWMEKAVSLANKIGCDDWIAGKREINPSSVCARVSLAMWNDTSTHGKRGPRVANAIRTTALKGWKFDAYQCTNGMNGMNGSNEKPP